MTTSAMPTAEQLAQWDAEDELNWTRAEFEIPSTKACGGSAGQSYPIFPAGVLMDKRARQFISAETVWGY